MNKAVPPKSMQKSVHSMDKARQKKNKPKRQLSWALLRAGMVLGLLGAVVSLAYLTFAPLTIARGVTEVIIPERMGATAIGRELTAQGVSVTPRWFGWLARLKGQASQLKAGSYEISGPMSMWALLDVLSRGDIRYREFRIPEGATFAQIRKNLANHPDLAHDSATMSERDILTKLGADQYMAAEGLFYPDTYLFSKNNTDFAVLKRAFNRQAKEVNKAWEKRTAEIPLKTPYEALILASIVEKETGTAADRGKVASVFVNRLRHGMMLQTDPTVIYGLGDQFEGNLRKIHLLTDTPYNTYTRFGLPPTPIAMPSKASTRAITGHVYYV